MIGENDVMISKDPSGFVNIADVVRDVILEIRYYSTYNFTGERIDGYEQPVALLTKELGTWFIYQFFFVIGVPASIVMIIKNAPILLLFCFIIVVFNMLFCFGFGKLLRFNLEDIIIASNANIGGPTTAAGMAIAQGWNALVGPCMLVGTLGYVIGTWLGIIVGSILGA